MIYFPFAEPLVLPVYQCMSISKFWMCPAQEALHGMMLHPGPYVRGEDLCDDIDQIFFIALLLDFYRIQLKKKAKRTSQALLVPYFGSVQHNTAGVCMRSKGQCPFRTHSQSIPGAPYRHPMAITGYFNHWLPGLAPHRNGVIVSLYMCTV